MNGLLQGLFILSMMILFVGTFFWAWSSKRQSAFDAAAKLPLEED